MAKRKKSHKFAVGVGIAAAVAGAYFLYGKDGAKNRKAVKSWALKARADVLEQLENAKDVGENEYHSIVDSVTAKYNGLKDISPAELKELSGELKEHWKQIAAQVKKSGKKTA